MLKQYYNDTFKHLPMLFKNLKFKNSGFLLSCIIKNYF